MLRVRLATIRENADERVEHVRGLYMKVCLEATHHCKRGSFAYPNKEAMFEEAEAEEMEPRIIPIQGCLNSNGHGQPAMAGGI